MSDPYFSIVMPVFNRQSAVRRALDSCLNQDFRAFEVVVVDDGSTDGTAAAVSGYSDPRVRLIRHARNRGANPARNTAVRASRGEWVIYLDSDDELLPGSLSAVHRYVAAADDRVDRLGFQLLQDDGRVSPYPIPREPVIRYAEWLRWVDRASLTDCLWATRRRCFAQCPLPESFALEFSYSLDFAKRFTSSIIPIALGVVHTDCSDRLSYRIPPSDPEMARRSSMEQAADWEYVLAEHGDGLREFAPRQYRAVLRNAAIAHLLAGNMRCAVRCSAKGLWQRPTSLYAWAIALLVLCGRRTTAILNRIRSERRRNSMLRLATTSAGRRVPAITQTAER